jgi:hypothetical protein
VTQTPNHVAIVLLVKIGDLVLLLGSDLEETGHPGTGWSVIVDSTTRPSDAAGFYKVPHHGSRNADYPSTWTDMLQTEPMAALTPFVRGNVKLPTENDVNRICSRTPKAYATAVPRQRQVRGRSNTVDRTIRETVRWIGEVYTSQGQIRLRKKILASGENDWHVKLFGDALPLRDMYKGS